MNNDAIKQATSIDVHAHAVLEESMGAAGEHGPELTETEGKPTLFRVGGYELHGVFLPGDYGAGDVVYSYICHHCCGGGSA